MVKIIGRKQATNEQGEPFNMLRLQGDVESVTSQNTGMLYLTAKKALIPSTFDEATCEELVGKKLQGTIERVPCDPYEYIIPENGEKVILEHTYQYNPSPVSMEEEVFENGRKEAVSV